MGFSAAIFDMDGTLIDSEKLNLRFWTEAAAMHGIDLAEEDVLYIRSLDSRLSRRYLEGKYPGFVFDRVRETRRELMRVHVETESLELKPGVREVLEELRSRGIRTAVATATQPVRAFAYLEMLGIKDLFDEIVCTAMVPNGKPAPDVYEFACGTLGLTPDRCIAIEDSPNGLRSARSAGCTTVFVPDLTGPDDSTAEVTDLLFDDLNEMCGYIASHPDF
ncbi:MAG: HAD family hydrolase [Candidatus Methanomethylophilaceae archaeon]